MNSAVSRTGSRRHNCPGFGRKFVDPFAGRDRLTRFIVGSKGRPITLSFVSFVGNGTFHHKYERVQRPFGSTVESVEKLVTVFVSEKQVVKIDLGNPGKCSQHEILNARLRRRGHRDGVAVAAQAGVDPKY